MPDLAMGVTAGIGLIGAKKNSNAVKSASRTEAQAAAAGIAEQRRQFDKVQELLSPFVNGGTDAFAKMLALTGSSGGNAQRRAISGIESSPQMAALVEQGENAILQNAAATGGLRGGNTQGAMAQFRPQILSGLIDQQYSRLGGLASMAQASAAGVGAAGQSMANNVSGLLAQQGSARAGGVLGQASAFNRGLGIVGGLATDYMNASNEPLFGGNSWGGF